MASSTTPSLANPEVIGNMVKFRDLAIRYRDDADFRAAIDGGDVSEAIEYLGMELPEGMTPKLHFDSGDTMHVALPPDPNQMLLDESLAAVAGGKTAGSAGSIGSASSLACSTVPSTVATASTASTLGSAGGDSTGGVS